MKYQVLQKELGDLTFRLALVPGRERLVFCGDGVRSIKFPDLAIFGRYQSGYCDTFVKMRHKGFLLTPLISNLLNPFGCVCLGRATNAIIRGITTPESAFFLTRFTGHSSTIKRAFDVTRTNPLHSHTPEQMLSFILGTVRYSIWRDQL